MPSISETSRRAILFADVCESTRIYETIGDTQALALINRLFKSLDNEVASHAGVTVKTLGDAMVCEFSDPDGAFRAACAMQKAAVDLATASESGGLKIKIGMTYGPVVIEDGDVFGDTVNVCSRLVTIANPAQVLTTRQMVDALSPGLRTRCRELYPVKVRNRAGEIMVCDVIWRLDIDTTRVNDTMPLDITPATPTWVLKLTHAGDTIVVDETGAVRIGREADNDLVVSTEHASRLHARIFSRDGAFFLADQSTNGTFLMTDGTDREVRLRRSEAVLGERGWIGLGQSAASHGDHVLRYRLERST